MSDVWIEDVSKQFPVFTSYKALAGWVVCGAHPYGELVPLQVCRTREEAIGVELRLRISRKAVAND